LCPPSPIRAANEKDALTTALLAAMMAHIQNGLVDGCMLLIVSNSREINAEPFGSCALGVDGDA
jgi:hypothetical protein